MVSRQRRRAAAVALTAATTVAATAVVGLAVIGTHRRAGGKRTPPSRASAAAPVSPPRTAAPRPPGPGHVQVAALPAADALGGRKVWIYRPGVPDSSALPVVYFLHGLPGSYRDLASLGVKKLLDRLISTRRLAPVVVAVPDGNSTRADDPEWADAPSHGLHLEDFVTGALRLLVEGTHPRDRMHRSIMGFSMGGYGAMNIALHHPSLYGAVASIAGYFDTDDESGIFNGDARLLAANRPDRHVGAARALRILLADGTDDQLAVTAGETQRFARLLRRSGVTPSVDIRPGSHSAQFLSDELPRALAFCVQGRV